MPELENLRLNFALAHEFNNAILSVYSLDCEEEFQFADFEQVPQSATFEILDRISKIHVDKYILPILEHTHTKAKESYINRMLKEKYLPISFLNRVAHITSPALYPVLLQQRLSQLCLLKEKIHSFFQTSVNLYDKNLDAISKKADEILVLAGDFVIDEPLLMEQLRKIRLVKLNIFLVIHMRDFLDDVEKAMKGERIPPKSGDYTNIYKIMSGRMDFFRCPQMERLVCEFLNAYGKLQTLEADYWANSAANWPESGRSI